MSVSCRTFPGGAVTDSVESTVSRPGDLLVSYAGWINLGTVPSGSPSNVICAAGELLFYDTVDLFTFHADQWTTQTGNWSLPSMTTGAWVHIAITYSYSNPANTPLIYKNGVSQTVTLGQAATGSFTAQTTTFCLGNFAQPASFAVNASLFGWARWLGYLLTQVDVTALAGTTPPCAIAPTFLSDYAPMDQGQSPEPNLGTSGGSFTVIGTSIGVGPTTVINPRCVPMTSDDDGDSFQITRRAA